MKKLLLAAVAAIMLVAPAHAGSKSEDFDDVGVAVRKMYPNVRSATITTVGSEVSFDIPSKRMACRLDGRGSSFLLSDCHLIRGAKP